MRQATGAVVLLLVVCLVLPTVAQLAQVAVPVLVSLLVLLGLARLLWPKGRRRW
jgi:hypothetical protein